MTNRDGRVEILLAGLIHDKILFIEIVSRFDDRLFALDEYNLFFSWLKKFFAEFRRSPNLAEFSVFVDKKDLAKFDFLRDVFDDPKVQSDVLRRQLYDRYQSIQTLDFIESVEQKMESNSLSIKDTFQEMKKVVLRTSQPDKSYIDLTSAVAANTYESSRDFRVENTTPLAFKEISAIAQGGIAESETLIFVAPPNRGKTTYLINELFQGCMNGEKCLFLSMENEADTVLARLYTRILLMTKQQQRVDSDLCKKAVSKFFRMVPTPVIMYKPADTFSIPDLDLWLEEYELMTGIRFQRVIVDYMNKFKKAKASKGSDEWVDVRKLSDDFRALGIARKLKMITAAQTNRSGIMNREGIQTESVHEGMIAGGFGQFETADIVLAYSETPTDRQRGGGRVGILKMRESGGRGREFVVSMAPWIGLITDDAKSLFPPIKLEAALYNPDRAYGELPGLEVKALPAHGDGANAAGGKKGYRRKGAAPGVAAVGQGQGSTPLVDDEVEL